MEVVAADESIHSTSKSLSQALAQELGACQVRASFASPEVARGHLHVPRRVLGLRPRAPRAGGARGDPSDRLLAHTRLPRRAHRRGRGGALRADLAARRHQPDGGGPARPGAGRAGDGGRGHRARRHRLPHRLGRLPQGLARGRRRRWRRGRRRYRGRAAAAGDGAASGRSSARSAPSGASPAHRRATPRWGWCEGFLQDGSEVEARTEAQHGRAQRGNTVAPGPRFLAPARRSSSIVPPRSRSLRARAGAACRRPR